MASNGLSKDTQRLLKGDCNGHKQNKGNPSFLFLSLSFSFSSVLRSHCVSFCAIYRYDGQIGSDGVSTTAALSSSLKSVFQSVPFFSSPLVFSLGRHLSSSHLSLPLYDSRWSATDRCRTYVETNRAKSAAISFKSPPYDSGQHLQ